MKKGLLILCFVSFAALACTILNRYITGTVELSGFSSTVEQHRDVADALGATYGSLHQNTEILALASCTPGRAASRDCRSSSSMGL